MNPADSLTDPVERLWQLWQDDEPPHLADFLALVGPLPVDQLLSLVRVDQEARWRRGERPLAETYLRDHPAIAADLDHLLVLVLSEFLIRQSLGENPDVEEYAARFPAHAIRLRAQIALHRALSWSGVPSSSTLTVAADDHRTLPEAPPVKERKGRPTIPGYDLTAELGKGGMGVVWKAWDVALKRFVAIKMIRGAVLDDPEYRGRFQAEAESAARLQHPNIVQIFALGLADEQPYLVMELVEGTTLAQTLAGVPQPPADAAQLVRTLTDAIQYAHARGIVHRDLKPANVLLASEGSGVRGQGSGKREGSQAHGLQPVGSSSLTPLVPKITDFGLAKQLDADSGQTKSGAILGTPSYMAPEQAEARPVGPTADVYALGCLLYELLTGRPPFRGTTVPETIDLVRHAEPVPPRRLRPGVPLDLETIALKCLEKDPARRYPSARALGDELGRFLAGEPILARPLGAGGRLVRWARRKPAQATASAFAVAGLLGVAIVSTLAALRIDGINTKLEGINTKLEGANLTLIARQEALTQGLAREERSAAASALDHGLMLCQRGDVGLGLVWLARAVEKAASSGDADLERVARTNVAAWTVLLSHPLSTAEERIAHLVLSPDGRLMAGSVGRTIVFWDVLASRRTGEPCKASVGLNALPVFSPDGQRVLASGQDGSLWLFDVASRQLVRPPVNDQGTLVALAYRPTGEHVLVQHADGRLQLLRADTLQPEGPPVAFRRTGDRLVAFSRDGRTLAVAATGSDEVQVYNVPELTPRGGPVKRPAMVVSVALDTVGQHMVSSSNDGTIGVWDTRLSRPASPLISQPQLVGDLLAWFGPDGRTVRTVDQSGVSRVWDAVAGQLLAPPIPAGERDIVRTPTTDGRRVASYRNAFGLSPSVWGLPAGPRVEVLPAAGGPRGVAFAADGSARIVSGGGVAPLILNAWPPDAAEPIELARRDGIEAAFVLPSANVVLTAVGLEGRLLDLATGQPRGGPLPLPRPRPLQVTAGLDGRVVFLGGDDPEGYISALVSATDGRVILAPKAPPPVTTTLRGRPMIQMRSLARTTAVLAVSPDGSTVIQKCVTGKTLAVGLGAVATTELTPLDGRPAVMLESEGRAMAAAYAPDGTTLVTANDDRTVRHWDAVTGKPRGVLFAHEGAVNAVAWSADGSRLLSGSEDGVAHLWDFAGRRLHGLPMVHPGPVMALAFSGDGRTLLTVGRDGTVRLWDAATTRPLGLPLIHTTGMTCWALSDDGRTVLTGVAGGSVRRWRLPAPAAGSQVEVTRAVQVQTRREWIDGAVREMDAAAWQGRRDARGY